MQGRPNLRRAQPIQCVFILPAQGQVRYKKRNTMKVLVLPMLIMVLLAIQADAQKAEVKFDTELRVAIESHTWYSARHGYRFLPNGIVSVDGYPTPAETWSIQGGLLYRKTKGLADFPSTRIIETNDRQLVEQEISGPYKGSVETMYSR